MKHETQKFKPKSSNTMKSLKSKFVERRKRIDGFEWKDVFSFYLDIHIYTCYNLTKKEREYNKISKKSTICFQPYTFFLT